MYPPAGRAASALGAFIELIEGLAAKVVDMPLHTMTQTTIEQSGLITYHQEEKGEKGQARIEKAQSGKLVAWARGSRDGGHGDSSTSAPSPSPSPSVPGTAGH